MIAQSGMEGGVREQFEIIEELAAGPRLTRRRRWVAHRFL